MSKHIVMRLLADRPIAYHPDIARVAGGVKAGIFLSQLLYWSDKGKRADGFIWKTQEEWELETALTRREQETARKTLKAKRLLDERLEGIPAKLYYKINTDLLYELLEALYVQASMHQSAIQDDTKQPSLTSPKCHTITEITAENTKEDDQPPSSDKDWYKRAIAAYENTFGPITYRASEILQDDIATYGETAVIEAIGKAKERRARAYAYVETILRGKAEETAVKQSGEALWAEVERYQQHAVAFNELSPRAQTAVRGIGGESILRSVQLGYEADQIKKRIMSYAQ